MPKPNALIVLVLLTALMSIGLFASDVYLPSLPSIRAEFITDTASVQLTLSVFWVAFGLSQLIYGPVCDRYGRRPTLLCGMAVYFVASVACAAATSIEMLVVVRFFQALGACCGPVVVRAVVRDVFGRDGSAKVLAYMGMAFALAPIAGPILGGYLEVWADWRLGFIFLATLGAVLLGGILFLLKETNVQVDETATNLSSMLRNYANLLGDRSYMGFVLCATFAFCGVFAFMSGSSFILIGLFGLTPDVFGLCYATFPAGYVIGAFIVGRRTAQLGIEMMVRLGTTVIFGSGVLLIVFVLIGFLNVTSILVPMFTFMIGYGMLHPTAVAGAIGPHASKAGAASGLLGFIQIGSAALFGVVVGHTLGESAVPMALAIFVAATALLLTFLLLLRPTIQQQPAGSRSNQPNMQTACFCALTSSSPYVTRQHPADRNTMREPEPPTVPEPDPIVA